MTKFLFSGNDAISQQCSRMRIGDGLVVAGVLLVAGMVFLMAGVY